jgi:hypothetical protein
MDRPSGDHWSELTSPCRWLTCFIALVVRVQTKMFSCAEGCNLPLLAFWLLSEQSERKASCEPSGDHAGCKAVHAPAVLRVDSPTVSGERMRSGAAGWVDPVGAMGVRCSSVPRSVWNVQATVLPSGEMAAEVGVRTRSRESSSAARRGSAVLAVEVGVGCATCAEAARCRQSTAAAMRRRKEGRRNGTSMRKG